MFTRDDLIKYHGMKKVISEGNYQVKGEAALAVASFFAWYAGLEKVITDNMDKKEIKPMGSPKPVKGN